MKKIYSILLLMVALICLPLSAKAATTVLSEGFEGDLSNWTKQSCASKTAIGTEAKHEGSYGFLFSYNTNPPQYLISTELSVPAGASDLSLTLYYKAYSGSYPETFKVGYSTTDNDVANFTWDAEVSTSETKTNWTQYSNATNSFTIPAGVKYIAIAYTASNQYKFYIDDILLTCTISGPSLAVLDGETALASGASYNFGLATAGTTKVFTLKNDGTEAAPVAVAHTGAFGAELSAASIPAGGSVDLTVTMPATSGSDVITISSTSEAIADFTLNVGGTVRDASKLFETLLDGSLPENWTSSGSWSWSTTNGASTTAWYESTNARLITPLLTVAEGETFIVEVQGTYDGYQGFKLEYSADGTTWTASATTPTITADWQSIIINDIPAGSYYIALHGWRVNIRNYYGGTIPAAPKNVQVSDVLVDGATISWTAFGAETAWQVSYSTTSGAPDNGTKVNADATSKALTGLTTNTTYYVSVRIDNGGSYGPWSNEVSFTPVCPAPTYPASPVSAITENGATVTWTAAAGITEYQFVCVKKDVTPNWEGVLAKAVTSATLEGLEASTAYDFYVRSYYNADVQSAPVKTSFRTACGTYSLPFATEEFGSALPDCWDNSVYTGNAWTMDSYNYYKSAYYSARYNAKTAVSNYAELKTPAILLSDKAVLSFYYKNNNSVTTEVVVTDGAKEDTIATIAATTGSSTTMTAKADLDLSKFEGKTVQIIFRAHGKGTSTTASIYIDDVAVDYAPVAAPTELAAAAKNASAIITWESDVEGATFDLRYREQGAEPEANWTIVANLTEKSYTITGLTNGTAYEVEVQAVASANRKSEWVATTVTPKFCAAVEAITFGAKTFNSVVVNWTSDAESTWNLRYKADTTNAEWQTIAEPIEAQTQTLVGLATGIPYIVAVKATCDEAWVEAADTVTLVYTKPANAAVVSITDAAATASWDAVADAEGYQVAVAKRGEAAVYSATITKTDTIFANLSALTEYDFYVAAVYGSHIEAAEKVEFATVAIAPKNLTVSALGTTTATLAWEYEGAATGFEFAIGDDADALEWAAATTPKELTALAANTSYTFYVRAAYENGAKSDSIKLTFRTECAKYTMPFEQSFNDVTSLEDTCWSNVKESTYGKEWQLYSNYVRLNCNAYPASKTELVSPVITLDKEAILKFKFQNAKGGEFFVLIDAGAAQRDTLAKNLVKVADWTEKEIDLSAYNGKNIQLSFVGTTNDKENAFICLDDVTITEKPACQTPTGLAASNILFDRATLTWTPVGAETAWQIGYREAGTDAILTIVDVTAATYELLGTAGTTYEVHVRAYCDETHQSEWSEALNVTPAYQAPTAVTVSEITTSAATVTWTANSGEAAWTLQYRKAGATEWSEMAVATTATAALSELAAGTKYEVRVLAGTAASETATFTTECAAVAALPWSENFNAAATGAVPTCWTAKGANGENQPTLVVSAGSWMTIELENNALMFTGANEQVAYAILPEITADLSNAQITFAHVIESAGKGAVDFGYLVGEAYTALKEVTSTTTMTAIDPFALPALPAGAQPAFRFTAASGSLTYSIAIDNILIDEKPACAVPTALAVSEITAHTVQLAWTSEATSFALEVKEGEGEWTAVNGIITNPYVLEGLKANTLYSARVKAVCGTDSESAFCDAISFTTDCEAVAMPFAEGFETEGLPTCWETENWSETASAGTWARDNSYAHSGYALRFNAKTAQSAQISTPAIILDKAATLSFYIRNVYGNNAGYVSGKVTAVDIEDATAYVEAAFINSKVDTLSEQTVDLSTLNGKTVKITFLANGVGSSTSASLYLDDVTVTAKIDPTGLDNANAKSKAIKRIENNSLVIIRDGVKYNAQGIIIAQ